jgi:hypothetical protein
MQLEEFVPSTGILIASFALSCVRFENQRWVRSRNEGMRGSSEGFGIFVDLTASLSAIFGIVFLIAFFYDFGWKLTVGLVAITSLSAMVFSVLIGFLFRGDNLAIWMLCTFAVWPMVFVVSRYVSWFGIFT